MRNLGSILFWSLLATATGAQEPQDETSAPGTEAPAQEEPAQEEPPRLSGEWIERDGTLVCDGYLTRRVDEDYCEAQVPADWRSFEFEGQTWYVQPLAQEPEPVTAP